jgi:hypothetical protein
MPVFQDAVTGDIDVETSPNLLFVTVGVNADVVVFVTARRAFGKAGHRTEIEEIVILKHIDEDVVSGEIVERFG